MVPLVLRRVWSRRDDPRDAAPATRAEAAASPAGGLLTPLRSRDYRLALGGRLFTLTGNAAQSVTLAVLVLDITQRPSGWGTLLTVQAVPQALLMLAGGVAVDRFRSRTVIVASNLLQALTLAPLLVAALLGGLELWHLYAYAVASGIVFALYIPASQTLVPELLPNEQVRSGNAFWVLAFNASRFIGPPVAATLIAHSGHAAALGASTAAFLVGAAALLPIRTATTVRRSRESTLHQLHEGLRAARRDAAVWTIILSAMVYNLGAAGATFVGLPSLAKLTLDAGDEGVGILYAAVGGGALLGVLVTGSLARIRRQAVVGAFTNFGMGLALIAAAFAPSVWVAVPLLVVSGAFQSAGGVIFLTLVQTRTAPEVRGRVIALLSFSLFGLTPLAYGLGGLLGDVLGPRGILIAGGAVIILCGAIMLARKPIRDVE